MKKRNGFIAQFALILIVVAIVGGIYIFEKGKTRESVQTAGSYIQYRPFSPVKNISSSVVYRLKPTDKLPTSVNVDNGIMVIREVYVSRSKLSPTNSFEVYVTVNYHGSDRSIGFSYRNNDPSTDRDGCGGNDCIGVLTTQIRRAISTPTYQEIQRGISNAVLTKYIGVSGIEYNFETSDWKNIEISLRTLREDMRENGAAGK